MSPPARAIRTEKDILADVKRLAVEYYERTGKPLGVTGEIAEFEAAEKLGLILGEARTQGYDAIRTGPRGHERIQIKGRRILPGKPRYGGRVPKIDLRKPFDAVALVLLDERYEVIEIWQAPRAAVTRRIKAPGSKARNERGSLGISQFKSIAEKVWPLQSEMRRPARP